MMRLKAATFLKDLRLPGTSSFKSQVSLGEPPTFDIWCDGAWIWVEKIRGVGAGSVLGVPREACSSIIPLDFADVRRPPRPLTAEEQLAHQAYPQLTAQEFLASRAQLQAQAALQLLQSEQNQLNQGQIPAQLQAQYLNQIAAFEPEVEEDNDEPVQAPRKRGGR